MCRETLISTLPVLSDDDTRVGRSERGDTQSLHPRTAECTRRKVKSQIIVGRRCACVLSAVSSPLHVAFNLDSDAFWVVLGFGLSDVPPPPFFLWLLRDTKEKRMESLLVLALGLGSSADIRAHQVVWLVIRKVFFLFSKHPSISITISSPFVYMWEEGA